MLTSFRGIKFIYFAGLMALIALISGVYFSFFQSRGFIKTEGIIVDYEEEHNSGEENDYYPIVEYSVDGTTYTEKLDSSGNPKNLGNTITIYYNPDDPTIIHNNFTIGRYLMVVGSVLLLIIIFSSIRELKDRKQSKETQEESGYAGFAPMSLGEERELYFLSDLGTVKIGHHIEDKNRKVLYEAKMTRFTLFGAYKFDFIDHEHGTTVPHTVGHAETSQWSSILIDGHSTFDFDGVDVWKVLKNNGITIESSYTAGEATLIGMKFRVFRDGNEIALAEMTSQYPHEDDAAEHKMMSKIPVEGFFRIWTREQNLDLVFLTIMAFTRTEATDGRGGNFGSYVGTMKNISKS